METSNSNNSLNKIPRERWCSCDVAHKHSCPLRMSPLENVLKCKHFLISRVRIKMILLDFELSLINALCCRVDMIFNSHSALITIIHSKGKLFLKDYADNMGNNSC